MFCIKKLLLSIFILDVKVANSLWRDGAISSGGMKTLPKREFRATKHIYALVHSTRLQTDSSLPLTGTSWAWQGLLNPAALPLSLFLPSMKPVERSPGSQVSFEVTAWIRCNARETGKFSPWSKASQSALCIVLGHCCSVPSTPASSASPSLPKCEAPASRPQPGWCLCIECFLNHLCAWVCSFISLAKCHLLCHATLEPCFLPVALQDVIASIPCPF